MKRATDPLHRLREKFSNKKHTFTFRKINQKEVENILRKMKRSRSCGVDGISSEMIKPVIKIIAPALTVLINRSLTDGIFPNIYKCAKVIPIFKNKGKRSDPGNYRPISNLSVFGKCQEIVVDIQLREYCEKYKLFGTHQHGFRRSRSTTTALLTAVTRWRTDRKKKYSAALLFDLSAAYDVLPKDLFLKKAEIVGIVGNALKWLESYLTYRTQVVQVNESRSEEIAINIGTPQGSSISCLIFASTVCGGH